jgi:hypothetical protein
MRVYAETPLVLFVLIKRPGDLAMHYLCSSLCESVLSSKVCMGGRKVERQKQCLLKTLSCGVLGCSQWLLSTFVPSQSLTHAMNSAAENTRNPHTEIYTYAKWIPSSLGMRVKERQARARKLERERERASKRASEREKGRKG